jgi:hypothetical protein
MKTYWFRGMGLLSLLMASTASSQANDIVNFLRAVNGPAPRQHQAARPVVQPVGHHDEHRHYDQNAAYRGGYSGGYAGQSTSSRDSYKYRKQVAGRDTETYRDSYGRHDVGYSSRNDSYDRVDLRHNDYGQSDFNHGVGLGRSGAQLSFQVSAGGGRNSGYGQPVYVPVQQPGVILPPVQSYPSAPPYSSTPSYRSTPSYPQAPVYPPMQSYPPVQGYPSPVSHHQIGEIVECRVPLATCVRVEDPFNIAPNAVPVVVAVRDPHLCAHECHERVAYVEICVPPCPPRCIRVSPCRTRVTLDFGRYQVDIKSVNGLIVVDYDN